MVELGAAFFFRTSVIESLTAPISFTDSDTGFMMDLGLITPGSSL